MTTPEAEQGGVAGGTRAAPEDGAERSAGGAVRFEEEGEVNPSGEAAVPSDGEATSSGEAAVTSDEGASVSGGFALPADGDADSSGEAALSSDGDAASSDSSDGDGTSPADAAGGFAGGAAVPEQEGETSSGGTVGGSAAPPEAAAARPEERLERAVRAAEQALIEYEIAVETFRIEVENFSRLHHQKLGPMYTRLDELDAQIAEVRAARSGDPEDLRKADEARARVMPMPAVEELFHGWMDGNGLFPEAAAMLTDQPVRPPQRVRPSDEARKLYRELARKAHPDLAQDETERARREEFITRVNAAYSRGDEPLLRELAEEWAAGPKLPEQGPTPSEELYARLEWLARRKELLTVVAKDLEESAIGAMLRLAPDDPDRLLDEIAEQLLGQVEERERELAELLAQ